MSAELEAAEKVVNEARDQMEKLYAAWEEGGLDPMYYVSECARLQRLEDEAQRRVQAACADEAHT